MGLFGKKIVYSERTTGIIVGVSAVKVNNMHLPLAEYEVDGNSGACGSNRIRSFKT